MSRAVLAEAVNNDLVSTIGERIDSAIKRVGVHKKVFARRIGVSPPLLSRWINDPRRPPSEESIQKIADAAGVPAAWIRYGPRAEPGGAVADASEVLDATTIRPSPRPDSDETISLAPDDMRKLVADVQHLGEQGERTDRKLILVDRFHDYLAAAERPIPDWLYGLRRRIEREEL